MVLKEGSFMIIVQVAGHLGQDPEIRHTPTGQKVTSIRVATNIKRGTKEKTVWWKVTLWGDRFDKKVPYLKKGSPILAIGEMGIPEIYTDKDGNPQMSLEVIADNIFFNPFGGRGDKPQEGMEGESAPQGARSTKSYPQSATSQPSASPFGMKHGIGSSDVITDDDLPF